MTRATFFKHFDLLAEQPDAVAKMRELVLELAVRGQIVGHDASEEPVSELLLRIDAERKKLRAAGESRIPDSFEKVEESQHSWHTPKHWAWRRLAELVLFIDYRGKTPVKTSRGVRLLTAKNIRKGYVALEPEEFIAEDSYRQWMTRGIPRIGDVLFTTEAPLGNAAVLELKERVALAQRTINFRLFADYDPKFMVLCICSRPYQEFLGIHATGMTATGIKSAKLKFLPFPVPPLAEQRRIVAKVDELMALCDELEQRQQARQHARGLLQQSALHHLLAARDPQTFAAAWQRVRDHFHLLHDTPDALPQLRQAILQLAVQGRLVPQNPKDECGAKLVARLSRKELPDTDHVLDEKFPASWGITAFTNLAHIRSGVTKGRNLAGRKAKSFPYLRVANVQRGYLDLAVMKDIEIPVEELEKFRLQPNDLLVTEGGDWDKVGRTAIWRSEITDCIHQNHVFRARLVSGELRPEWFMLYFNSPVGRRYFEASAKQTTNLASINATELRECPVPVPPLAEQKRIVARVEELLRWCDTLEAQLHQTRTLGAHLLASTLHHLLAA